MQELIISIVAVVASKFIHDCHADLYLGSEQATILVSAELPRNHYAAFSPAKPSA